MNSKRFLIRLAYLGFRYHGVQKQPSFASIQERVERGLIRSFPGQSFTTRFSSRTDSMVSAMENYCLLMFETPCELKMVNLLAKQMPPDIQIYEILPVDDQFTLMRASKEKEYHYYFAHGERAHPFASPFMTFLQESLDIKLMQEGAKLFCGNHYFENYSYKPKTTSKFNRQIFRSEIAENTELKANFFPEKSYVFKVSGEGFLRGQVRLMMGALFRLGKGEMTLEEIAQSLKGSDPAFVKWMSPASGLVLHKTHLELGNIYR